MFHHSHSFDRGSSCKSKPTSPTLLYSTDRHWRGSQDQIQVSHGLTISEQLNTGFHSRILENARRTVPENSTEPPTILRTPYRRTMKRPAAAAEAAVRPKKPKAAAEHDEEAPEFWDYETNPPGTPGTNHRNDAELAQGRLPPPRVPGAGRWSMVSNG